MQIVLEIIFTGGSVSIERLFAKSAAIIKGFVKKAGSFADDVFLSLDKLISLIKKGADNFASFIRQIFDDFFEWLKNIFKSGKVDDILDKLEKLYLKDIELLYKNKFYKEILDELKIKRIYPEILRIEEEAVLKFYTTNSGYKNFNKALRGEIELTEEFLAQERVMNQALDKLPISIHNNPNKLLYRIEHLSEEQINKYYKLNETVTNNHFTSSTYDLEAIGEAMRERPYTVLIRIEGKNGKLIEGISTLEKEREILFNSKTEFYVSEIKETSNPSDFASKIKTIILIEK